MKLSDARVLLTGASGGIGAATAHALLAHGACVLLSARSEAGLKQLHVQLGQSANVEICVADLTKAEDRAHLAQRAATWRGGVNTLINNAGVSELQLFERHAAADLERALTINLLAPMHLCRELLPHLRRQPRARILNVGSVMGALGHPGYSVYCATKFGLRGFSEALRRELADANVHVHYLAPRATRTPINSAAVVAMNAALGTRMDPPARVAREILRMLERETATGVIGWPEKLFARVNQVLPRLVDRALRRQLPTIKQHATASAEHAASEPRDSISLSQRKSA